MSESSEGFLVLRLPGMIPFFPDIMDEVNESETNITALVDGAVCMCSDLQTEDYSPLYAWYNYVLIILALPPLSIFGVCTNIVNVFIYSRKRLQNSANTYLLFLACSDFLVIVTGLFIFWIDSARSYIPELARAPYTTVYTLPFGYMAQTCSIYFTVAAAFDCYINVCYKSLANSYCTIRRAKQICFSIVAVSIMYNSLRFPQFNLRKCYHETSQEQIIEICPTSLFFTINTIYNVYMYMVLMTLLPFLFLLCLNAIILLRQNVENKKQMANSVSDEKTPKPVDPSASGDDTITMIMVVILFLACNTLALVVNMIETFSVPDPLVLNLLSDASNFLVVFNSSVNCVIYLVFNNEYREVFMQHARSFWHRRCWSSPRCKHGVYQPVAARDKMSDSEVDRSSPIWQPLSARRLPNLEWGGGCFDPAHHMTHMDEEDSGWDDENSYQGPIMNGGTNWLAELNIVDTEENRRPHIVVRALGHRDSFNVTSL